MSEDRIMHTQQNNGKCRSTAKTAVFIGATMTALTLLSGCLTSPYYGQIFNARTDLIPVSYTHLTLPTSAVAWWWGGGGGGG